MFIHYVSVVIGIHVYLNQVNGPKINLPL